MLVVEVVGVPGRRLGLEERRVIERGLAAGLSRGQIAVVLGRHASTVGREIVRAGGPGPVRPGGRVGRGRPRVYRAVSADRVARGRAARPKPCRLVGRLAGVVSVLLAVDWSPGQIAALLPVLFPDDESMRISHETIYRSLFVQGRGELRRELAAHLRSGQTARRPRRGGPERRGRLVGMVSIAARPAEAADRAVPGHWEGDLLCGAPGKGTVITLVERTSRFVLLAPLPAAKAVDAREALTGLVGRLPAVLRRSLTWDQGKEMAQHAQFSLDTGLAVYFCDPHSPWQRGSNENTNGLLRQYWPKGCDLRQVTQQDCDAIAERLNTRPRQTLNWQTPAQALDRALLATTS